MSSKSIFLGLLVIAAGTALAAGAPKGFKRHAVGAGVHVDLPKGWKLRDYPMPMAATNFRVDVDDLRMAITGFVYPDGRTITPSMPETLDTLAKVNAQYAAGAKPAAEPTTFTNGELIGAYSTLTSASGAPAFRVFGDSPYACVTTAIVKSPKSTFAISIGSGSCEGEAHRAATAAIAAMAAD